MSNFGRFGKRKSVNDTRPNEYTNDKTPRSPTQSVKGHSLLGYLNPRTAFTTASAALSTRSSHSSVASSTPVPKQSSELTLHSSSSKHFITDLVTVMGYNGSPGTFQWHRLNQMNQSTPLTVTTTPFYSPSIDDVNCSIYCQFIPNDAPSKVTRTNPIGPFKLNHEQKSAIANLLCQPIQQSPAITMLSTHFYTDAAFTSTPSSFKNDDDISIDSFLDNEEEDDDNEMSSSLNKRPVKQSLPSSSSSSSLTLVVPPIVPPTRSGHTGVNIDDTTHPRDAFIPHNITPFLFVPTVAMSHITREMAQTQKRLWASITIYSPIKSIMESNIKHGVQCNLSVIDNTIYFSPVSSQQSIVSSTSPPLSTIDLAILKIPVIHAIFFISLQEFSYPSPTTPVDATASPGLRPATNKEVVIPSSIIAHLIDTRDNTIYSFQFKSEYERDLFILSSRERKTKLDASTNPPSLANAVISPTPSGVSGMTGVAPTPGGGIPLHVNDLTIYPSSTSSAHHSPLSDEMQQIIQNHPGIQQAVYHNTYHPLQSHGAKHTSSQQHHDSLALPSFDRYSSSSTTYSTVSAIPSELSGHEGLVIASQTSMLSPVANPHLHDTTTASPLHTLFTDPLTVQHSNPMLSHQHTTEYNPADAMHQLPPPIMFPQPSASIVLPAVPYQPSIDFQAQLQQTLQRYSQSGNPSVPTDENSLEATDSPLPASSPSALPPSLVRDLITLVEGFTTQAALRDQTIAVLQQEKEALHMDAQTTRAQYELIRSQYKNALQTDSRYQAKCHAQEQELQNQQELVRTLQQKLSQLEAHFGPTQRELGKLKQENLSLRSSVDQLEISNKSLIQDKQSLHEDYRRIYAQYQSRQRESISLQSYIKYLQRDMSSLYQHIEAKDDEIDQLRNVLLLPPSAQSQRVASITPSSPLENIIPTLTSRSPEGIALLQTLPAYSSTTATSISPAAASSSASPTLHHSLSTSSSSSSLSSVGTATTALKSVTNKMASGLSYLSLAGKSSTARTSTPTPTPTPPPPSPAASSSTTIVASTPSTMTATTSGNASARRGSNAISTTAVNLSSTGSKSESSKQIIQLHYQLQQSEMTIVDLNNQLSELTSEYKHLSIELQDIREENNDITMALRNTQKKLTIADQSHELAIEQVKRDCQETINQHNEEINQLRLTKVKAQTLQNDLVAVQNQLSSLEHTITQYQHYIADYTTKISSLETDLTHYREQYKLYEQLMEDHKALQSNYDNLHDRFTQLDQQYTTLLDTSAIQELRISELESALQLYLDRIDVETHNKVVTEREYYHQKCVSLSSSLEHILHQRQQQQHLVDRQQYQIESLRLEIEKLQYNIQSITDAQNMAKNNRWSLTSPLSWRKRSSTTTTIPTATSTMPGGSGSGSGANTTSSPRNLPSLTRPLSDDASTTSTGSRSNQPSSSPNNLMIPMNTPLLTDGTSYTPSQSDDADGNGNHNPTMLSYDQLQLEWSLLKQQVRYQQEDLARLQSYARRLLQHYQEQDGSSGAKPLAWTLRLLSNMNPMAYLPSWRTASATATAMDPSNATDVAAIGLGEHLDEFERFSTSSADSSDTTSSKVSKAATCDGTPQQQQQQQQDNTTTTPMLYSMPSPQLIHPLTEGKNKVEQLKNVISMLTLTITEKEEIIYEMRKVNVLLGEKIQRLEGTLKLHQISYLSPRAGMVPAMIGYDSQSTSTAKQPTTAIAPPSSSSAAQHSPVLELNLPPLSDRMPPPLDGQSKGKPQPPTPVVASATSTTTGRKK